MWWLVAGLFAGAFLGMLIVALAAAAKDANHRNGREP